MGSLTCVYDALVDAATKLTLAAGQDVYEEFDTALRVYVKECQAGLRADIGMALTNLADEATETEDHHMRLVIRLVDEILDPILRGSE